VGENADRTLGSCSTSHFEEIFVEMVAALPAPLRFVVKDEERDADVDRVAVVEGGGTWYPARIRFG
jgi:hypothetical protein